MRPELTTGLGRWHKAQLRLAGRHEQTLGGAIIERTRRGFRDPQGQTLEDARLEYEARIQPYFFLLLSTSFLSRSRQALQRLVDDTCMKKYPPPPAAYERLKKPGTFAFIKKFLGF